MSSLLSRALSASFLFSLRARTRRQRCPWLCMRSISSSNRPLNEQKRYTGHLWAYENYAHYLIVHVSERRGAQDPICGSARARTTSAMPMRRTAFLLAEDEFWGVWQLRRCESVMPTRPFGWRARQDGRDSVLGALPGESPRTSVSW